jgi:hypothetical protein
VLLILLFNIFTRRVPSYGPGAKPDYGRPYAIGVMLLNVALWNIIPQCVFFFVFRVLTESLFPLQTNAACIQIVGLPLIPSFLAFWGLALVGLSDSRPMLDTIAREWIRRHADAAPTGSPPKVLVVGGTARGGLFTFLLHNEHTSTEARRF